MNSHDLQIVTIKTLFQLNLGIPLFQRPYRWASESAMLLFNDIYSSFKKNNGEYRIGTVILYRKKNLNNQYEYQIVDGQQRITTLSLLIYALKTTLDDNNLMSYLNLFKKDGSFNALSVDSIRKNYEVLKEKCDYCRSTTNLKSFSKYILEKCTFVKIVTNSEQQAFQFFDSQNSRGKELAPHDLLKSYHLREMANDSETVKKTLIGKWERINQEELAGSFAYHFYPLIKWHKKEVGINYSVKQIEAFKGIKSDDKFNYVFYHLAVLKYYKSKNTESFQNAKYQLTQPVIAGKEFFSSTLHYYELIGKVIQKIEDEIENPIVKDKNGGNGYVRNLFINAVLFFADRFGMDSLVSPIILKFYKWAYSLRLVMYSVYIETVNNYALGINKRANENLNMFNIIADMKSPSELDAILLQKIKKDECKYSQNNKLWNELFGDENG